MGNFFYNLGKMVGPSVRKANWLWRSLTGSEAESLQAEHEVGRDLAQAFLQDIAVDPEPQVAQLVQDLGSRLTGALPTNTRTFRFQAVQTSASNAFALPGGFIFVTRPLLELCHRDADEVAFILGHEMGHVIRRHVIERVMTDTLFSAVIRKLPSPVGPLRVPLGQLLRTLVQRGYSRDQELDADRQGVRLVRAAGFDASGAIRLLRRLHAQFNDASMLDGFFASHPPLDLRIRHIERTLQE